MEREELLYIQQKPQKQAHTTRPKKKNLIAISICTSLLVLLFVCAVIITICTHGFSSTPLDPPTQEESQAFESFQLDFKRFHTSAAANYERFLIFVQNYRKIQALNERGDGTYKLEVNEFADLTDEEFKQRYTGLGEDDISEVEEYDEDLDLTMGWRLSQQKELPASVANKQNCQPARHQMTCGACYAFTATSAIECEYKMKKNIAVELSPQQLVDCSFDYGNAGCEGGLMKYAFNYIKEHNITTENTYPYTNSEHLCKFEGGPFSIQSYTGIQSQSVIAFKKALAKHVLTVAIETTPGIRYYHSGVLKQEDVCGKNIDHAVVATGYEVEVQEDGSECLIVQLKNSWGMSYGEDGYFYGRVCSDDCGMLQKSTYVIV